jgi:hypothetical protein
MLRVVARKKRCGGTATVAKTGTPDIGTCVKGVDKVVGRNRMAQLMGDSECEKQSSKSMAPSGMMRVTEVTVDHRVGTQSKEQEGTDFDDLTDGSDETKSSAQENQKGSTNTTNRVHGANPNKRVSTGVEDVCEEKRESVQHKK